MEHPTRKTPYPASVLNTLVTDIRWTSPEEARTIRDTTRFERQRSIRVDHIHRLAGEMVHGWFLAGTPIWFCVLPDNSMVLVNGNHTLEAVAESGVSVPLTFVYQEVASMDEAAQAYACFDIQRSRTWAIAAHAVGADKDLPNAGKIIAAIGIIQGGFSGGTNTMGILSRNERFALLEEYRGAASRLHAAMVGAPDINENLVYRGAVLAVALATMKWQPSAAEEFWGGLAMDDGLRKNDPRQVLLRYLRTFRSAGGSQRRDQAIAAANSWNAFFTGRSIEGLRPGSVVAFELAGTPWARKGKIGPLPVIRKTPPKIETATITHSDGTKQIVTNYAKQQL